MKTIHRQKTHIDIKVIADIRAGGLGLYETSSDCEIPGSRYAFSRDSSLATYASHASTIPQPKQSLR
jgi:hypothetical protein